jgi:hypothetical protein
MFRLEPTAKMLLTKEELDKTAILRSDIAEVSLSQPSINAIF